MAACGVDGRLQSACRRGDGCKRTVRRLVWQGALARPHHATLNMSSASVGSTHTGPTSVSGCGIYGALVLRPVTLFLPIPRVCIGWRHTDNGRGYCRDRRHWSDSGRYVQAMFPSLYPASSAALQCEIRASTARLPISTWPGITPAPMCLTRGVVKRASCTTTASRARLLLSQRTHSAERTPYASRRTKSAVGLTGL